MVSTPTLLDLNLTSRIHQVLSLIHNFSKKNDEEAQSTTTVPYTTKDEQSMTSGEETQTKLTMSTTDNVTNTSSDTDIQSILSSTFKSLKVTL